MYVLISATSRYQCRARSGTVEIRAENNEEVQSKIDYFGAEKYSADKGDRTDLSAAMERYKPCWWRRQLL